MARFDSRLLLVTLLAGSANCLLFTDPINMAPTVEINEPNSILYRGQETIFSATLHDPDQSADSLQAEWRFGPDYETAARNPARSCHVGTPSQCDFSPSALGQSYVVVNVTDKHGATATDRRVFVVENRPPEARVDLIGPTGTASSFPLLTTFEFSAAGSTDPDPDETEKLSFTWTVTQPDGSKLVSTTCPPPKSPSTCSFVADQKGDYDVLVEAKDPNGATGLPAGKKVSIQGDRPPCIVGFAPATLRPVAFSDETTTLQVTRVDDDMDPYPPLSGSFVWKYRTDTTKDFERLTDLSASTSAAGYNTNSLSLEAGKFSLGMTVQVRVEYQDRVGRSLESCSPNADRCELQAGCAQWLTWTLTIR